MARLTKIILTQQVAPSNRGLPPVLISLTILVFRPIAPMAITIKNLLTFFIRAKNPVTILALPPVIIPLAITRSNKLVMIEQSIKYRINLGNMAKKLIFLSPWTPDFLVSYRDRQKVIGIIARVLVNFTIVAESSTADPVLWMLSHDEAAAVTDEVSFMAVPANMAKPLLDRPNISPKIGNIKAAIILKKKITEIAWAISSLSASTTGAVAAMADPPQIDEPTPTRIEIFLGIFKTLHKIYDTIRDVAIVQTIMGIETLPTLIIICKFRPKPSKITAYWSTFFDTKLIPG